jgi:FAD/FMN-containing dehydrogenase
VLAAVRPWRAQRDYPFAPETLARLRAVKDAYDPTGLFRSNRPITVS